MDSYVQGALVRTTATFTNEAGAAADPTVVTVRVKSPQAAVTSYVYGTDPEVIKSSTGVYYMDVDTTSEAGLWSVNWSGTGAVQAAVQEKFFVDARY